MAERLEVVCALLCREGKVAIFQRLQSDEGVGGKWEFPGGKVEPTESLRKALVRELREELEIEASCLTFTGKMDWCYPHLSLTLHAFQCESWLGEILLNEHQQFEWVPFSSLGEYDLADADRALLGVISEHL